MLAGGMLLLGLSAGTGAVVLAADADEPGIPAFLLSTAGQEEKDSQSQEDTEAKKQAWIEEGKWESEEISWIPREEVVSYFPIEYEQLVSEDREAREMMASDSRAVKDENAGGYDVKLSPLALTLETDVDEGCQKGDELSYSILVRNEGEEEVTDLHIFLQDALSLQDEGQVIQGSTTWEEKSLKPGESLSYEVKAVADAETIFERLYVTCCDADGIRSGLSTQELMLQVMV